MAIFFIWFWFWRESLRRRKKKRNNGKRIHVCIGERYDFFFLRCCLIKTTTTALGGEGGDFFGLHPKNGHSTRGPAFLLTSSKPYNKPHSCCGKAERERLLTKVVPTKVVPAETRSPRGVCRIVSVRYDKYLVQYIGVSSEFLSHVQ